MDEPGYRTNGATRKETSREGIGGCSAEPPIRRKSPKLTLNLQILRDNNEAIEVRTGLTKDEFDPVLELSNDKPQGIRRGENLWTETFV